MTAVPPSEPAAPVPASAAPDPKLRRLEIRPAGSPRPFTYHAAQFLFGSFFRVYCRLETSGLENVPAEGPCLILPNHVSHLDPPLMGAAVPREIHTLARHDLYGVPGLTWFMRNHNVHPIRRGSVDRETIRLCVSIVSSGWPLMIFAEGTRSEDGRTQRPKGGFGMVIDELPGVPCVPFLISGTERALGRRALLPRPANVTLRAGEPFFIPPRGEKESRRFFYERCADTLYERWRALGAPCAEGPREVSEAAEFEARRAGRKGAVGSPVNSDGGR